MFLSHDTIFPSDSITLVSRLVRSGKKISWQTESAKSFDICGCKIQNLLQKFVQCLLPILLIQQKPFAKFATMQS